MRELRFRAWHKKAKVLSNSKDINGLVDDAFDYDVNEIEWMQYIGMKDSAGTGIYESDVLRDPGGRDHKVVWERYFANFSTVCCDTGEASDMIKDEVEECFIIVGNIYENPELLE